MKRSLSIFLASVFPLLVASSAAAFAKAALQDVATGTLHEQLQAQFQHHGAMIGAQDVVEDVC